MDSSRLTENEADPTQQGFGNDPQFAWNDLYLRSNKSSGQSNTGYLPFGWKRVLHGEGKDAKWLYTSDAKQDDNTKYYDHIPEDQSIRSLPDIYSKQEYQNTQCTVQIVDFKRDNCTPPSWYRPMSDDIPEITETLQKAPPQGCWRWVHCTGLNGPTMKAIATATGWNEHIFSGIFLWSRAGIEWTDNNLLVQFVFQGTKLYIWFGGASYPVFITCACPYSEKNSTITRIMNFVDHGAASRNVVVSKDPSLMFYGIVRSIIHESLLSVSQVTRIMDEAYRKGFSSPGFFYELHNKLFTMGLDVASFKNATQNLVNAAKKLSNDKEDPNRLLSEQTCNLLESELKAIDLLAEELKDVSKSADGIVDLAFNTFAFKTNSLLQFLTVITLAVAPFSIVTGILGVNYFDDTKVTGKTIGIALGVTGGVVFFFLLAAAYQFYETYGIQQRREHKILKRPNQLLSASIPLQTPPFLRGPENGKATDLEKLTNTEDRSRQGTRESTLPLYRTPDESKAPRNPDAPF